MYRTPFIWLGSGRTKRRGTGGEALWLDTAAAAGLPVPAGAVVLDELYQLLLSEEAIQFSAGAGMDCDCRLISHILFDAVRFPRLEYPIMVRSLFANTTARPLPNPSIVRASIDPPVTDQLAKALADAYGYAMRWESANGAGSGVARRDLLVMEMVKEARVGTVISLPASEYDLVQTQDHGSGGVRELPRLRAWRLPDKTVSLQNQRLQRLMRGIRRTLKDRGWSVQWADDGRICWLTGIEPHSPPPGDILRRGDPC